MSVQQPFDGQYDRGIIPAETAARQEREGENYQETPEATSDMDTTAGYTVDQEGLTNNYAIEPEMYYEEPGDLREKEEALKAQRRQELQEINQTDQNGKLTMKKDTRTKGVGAI